MSKRLRIDCHDSGLPANPKSRWIIFASQGDWSNIILSYRALPGSHFGLGELIAHCCRQGIDDVLERIHAKVLRGLPVWFNDERVDTEEVKRLLDAHDHETD
jgi:hypothetical protein